MPRDFPDMASLLKAARIHKFRQPTENEAMNQYREALADHVFKLDVVESGEIRSGRGWDKQTPEERFSLLLRNWYISLSCHAEVAALHETLNQTEVATATPAEVAAVHEEVTDDRGL